MRVKTCIQVDEQGLFYGGQVVYAREVATLESKFTSAMGEVESERWLAKPRPGNERTAKWESNQDDSRHRRDLTPRQGAEDTTLFRPEGRRYSVQQLWNASDKSIPSPDGDMDRPFLLAIEDVFSVTGRGTVATGRSEHGRVRVGDEVELVGLDAQRKTLSLDYKPLLVRLSASLGHRPSAEDTCLKTAPK